MPNNSLTNNLSKAFPYVMGIAIPSVVIGPALMGALFGFSIILLACYPKRKKMLSFVQEACSSPIAITLMLMFIFWLISSILSIDPARSLEKWLRTIVIVIFSLFLCGRFSDESKDRIIAIKTMLISTALTAVLLGTLMLGQKLYYQQIVILGDWIKWSRESYSICFFMHCDLFKYKDFAQVLICLLPITVFALNSVTKTIRWLALASLPFGAWVAIYTETKSALLGVLCGTIFLVIWLLMKRMKSKYAIVAALLLLIAGIASTISLIKSLPQDVELKNNPDGQREYHIPFNIIGEHRQIIWSFSYDKFTQSPWLGFGPDVSGDLPGAKEKIKGWHPTKYEKENPKWMKNKRQAWNQEYIPSHPHSWLFELMVETGFLGLVAFLVTLSHFFYTIFKKPLSRMTLSLILLNGVYWSMGLVSFSFWSARWQIVYLALTALLLSTQKIRSKDDSKYPETKEPTY